MKEHEVRKLEEKVKKEEEESRSKEKQLQECRVEVASMQGKIESLKVNCIFDLIKYFEKLCLFI